MERKGVISEREAQRWFRLFGTGEVNTEDLPRSGSPKLWDIENIHRVLEESPQKSARILSDELGAAKDTIHHQIKTLEKSCRSCRSVSNELAPQLAKRRLGICRKIFGNPMDDRLLRELLHMMKNGYINATLTHRNRDSVPVNC